MVATAKGSGNPALAISKCDLMLTRLPGCVLLLTENIPLVQAVGGNDGDPQIGRRRELHGETSCSATGWRYEVGRRSQRRAGEMEGGERAYHAPQRDARGVMGWSAGLWGGGERIDGGQDALRRWWWACGVRRMQSSARQCSDDGGRSGASPSDGKGGSSCVCLLACAVPYVTRALQ